jgi:glycosyltransferase involved in cell wall biosynthesis
MEVIHIILGKANPNRMNGVNKVVNSLATYQAKKGTKVTVWGITKNPVHDYPIRNYVTVLFKETSTFFLPIGMKKAIQNKEDGTVFHFHGGFISQFVFIARLILRRGFKYVFTPHGSYNTIAMERSNWKKKLYISLFERALVENAKSLHFIGLSEIEGAKQLFQIENYELVPNGQNAEEVEVPSDSKKENLFPIFGFCGRLDVKTKGLDLLLKGFAEYLTTKECKGELWLIGDGKEKDQLVGLAQNLNIGNQVKFLGSLYGIEKIEKMNQLDYFILTSRNEGLPGVILEASVLGVPCIVSKETNMGDYITQNEAGITLDQNIPAAIANAMQTASNWKSNGKINRVRKNAKQMIENQFNWKTIAQNLEQLYV